MTEYLNIDRNAQSSLIKSIKRGSGLTWRRIWEEIGVCRSMMYFYRSGKCRIPRENLQKFVDISKYQIDTTSLPFVKANYSLRTATISEMNVEMAEFLGILYGDGCLGSHNYSIGVAGNAESDLLYHQKRVKPLIEKLFGIKPHFRIQNNAIHTFLYSRLVV